MCLSLCLRCLSTTKIIQRRVNQPAMWPEYFSAGVNEDRSGNLAKFLSGRMHQFQSQAGIQCNPSIHTDSPKNTWLMGPNEADLLYLITWWACKHVHIYKGSLCCCCYRNQTGWHLAHPMNVDTTAGACSWTQSELMLLKKKWYWIGEMWTRPTERLVLSLLCLSFEFSIRK